MTDRRRPAAGQSGQEDNPFAPPPEDRPDRPWQPRRPAGANRGGGGAGDGDGDGAGTNHGNGGTGGGHGNGDDGRDEDRAPWGSQWSRRQPGRQSGGFGNRPGNGRDSGPNGQGKNRGGRRWDPSDPAQRRARFALLGGMWGFFFALFNIPSIALLLGALALYWGISSLRMKPRTGADAQGNGGRAPAAGPGEGGAAAPGGPVPPGAPAPPPPAAPPAPPGQQAPSAPPARNARPQAAPAVMGLVTGGIAVAIVAATFSFQLIYRDYYTCVEDALTTPARESCEKHLPEQLRPLIADRD